jgi:hypothetical protein
VRSSGRNKVSAQEIPAPTAFNFSLPSALATSYFLDARISEEQKRGEKRERGGSVERGARERKRERGSKWWFLKLTLISRINSLPLLPQTTTATTLLHQSEFQNLIIQN